LSRALN